MYKNTFLLKIYQKVQNCLEQNDFDSNHFTTTDFENHQKIMMPSQKAYKKLKFTSICSDDHGGFVTPSDHCAAVVYREPTLLFVTERGFNCSCSIFRGQQPLRQTWFIYLEGLPLVFRHPLWPPFKKSFNLTTIQQTGSVSAKYFWPLLYKRAVN